MMLGYIFLILSTSGLVSAVESATSTSNQLPPEYVGLESYTPGVVGMRMFPVVNQTGLDARKVRKMNTRIRQRLLNKLPRGLQKLTSRLNRRNEGEEFEEQEVPDSELQGPTQTIEQLEADSELDSGGAPASPPGAQSTFYAESIHNRLTYYLLNITLGSPPQNFMVQVDTGSSDLWVPGRNIQFNGFDSKKSSSFKRISEDFNIKYVKDSAQGYWGTDTFGFGNSDVQVSDLQFAVATAAPDATMGILGIGPLESETSHTAYPNLPIMLVRDGFINRAVYSMYMGDLESNSGAILFGGSDKAKYRSLTTLPLVSKSTLSVELDIVALTTSQGPDRSHEEQYATVFGDASDNRSADQNSTADLSLENHDTIVSRSPLTVLLDTGTSLTYLPADIVNQIASAFKAVYENDVGMFLVNEQDLKNNPIQGLNFQFENQVIYMPKSELFWPLSWFSLEPSPYYAMTILASDGALGYNILGDSFLRNAYVVYDLDEKEVHLGQYYPSEFSHIVPF